MDKNPLLIISLNFISSDKIYYILSQSNEQVFSPFIHKDWTDIFNRRLFSVFYGRRVSADFFETEICIRKATMWCFSHCYVRLDFVPTVIAAWKNYIYRQKPLWETSNIRYWEHLLVAITRGDENLIINLGFKNYSWLSYTFENYFVNYWLFNKKCWREESNYQESIGSYIRVILIIILIINI